MKQERAARTREALIEAAADAFDRFGYAGAGLVRISRAADISMGALTFHFHSKQHLADTVQARGTATAAEAVARVWEGNREVLGAVVAITVEIARLLEEDPTVRAAARLARERCPHRETWPQSWLPALEQLLARSSDSDAYSAGEAESIHALAVHLVAGAEVYIRNRAGSPESEGESAPAQLAHIWDLALHGIHGDQTVPSSR